MIPLAQMTAGQELTLGILDLTIKVVAGVAMAAWAVHTWRGQRERDRAQDERERQLDRSARQEAERESERQAELERRQRERELEVRERERRDRSARYLNPYLLACEQLQSRLYNLLERGGRQYLVDEAYRRDTLYLFAQFLGWQDHVLRHHLHDGKTVHRALGIVDLFARDPAEWGVPFRFFRSDQRSLASSAVHRQEGEIEAVPFEAFSARTGSSELGRQRCVRDALGELERAAGPEGFDPGVRARLEHVQAALVGLLEHVEAREDLSFFAGGSGRRLCADNETGDGEEAPPPAASASGA